MTIVVPLKGRLEKILVIVNDYKDQFLIIKEIKYDVTWYEFFERTGIPIEDYTLLAIKQAKQIANSYTSEGFIEYVKANVEYRPKTVGRIPSLATFNEKLN
ncbi:hypothetical protein [Peribacillus loiseleuriae]|uniref:Uncharacterized protein n=1 Tax=Peribacillus loiseleuriae TaxID=1679170 RepID=A0A0K9GPS3_9BACI|nr:hypothetical protein [Peribacillus loiseleuriae]KMY48267.1 hypothetical protein AC625_00900 [Peribacillus loiseleuriae]